MLEAQVFFRTVHLNVLVGITSQVPKAAHSHYGVPRQKKR